MAPPPPVAGSAAAEAARYYATYGSRVPWGALLFMLGSLLLVVWSATLFLPAGNPICTLGFGSGLLLVGLLLAETAVYASPPGASPEVARFGNDLQNYLFMVSALPTAAFAACAAIEQRYRPWLRWLAAAAAAVQVLHLAEPFGGGTAFGAGGYLSEAAFGVFLLWLLAASVVRASLGAGSGAAPPGS